MTKIRLLSRSCKPADEPDPIIRAVSSRSYWVGAQDHESCRDARLEQLLCFGQIDESDLRRAVTTLEDRHALLSAEAAAAEMEPAHAAERTEIIEAQARLGAIARLAEIVAGDVGGLGAASLAASGGRLAERLAAIQRELEKIAGALHDARRGYLAAQLERLGLAGARDLKIHLGAGETRLDGWVNCDIAPAELAFNMAWGLPFEDGSVAYAYSGHAFEHLYYATEALGLLREIKRVLRPGGVFRFIVPNVGLFLRKYAADDRGFFEHWRSHAVKYFGLFDTPMELIMMYCQVGRDPCEFYGHKMGYDFETVEKLARRAGFARALQSNFMASAHTELRVDNISPAANLVYEGERYSLFVDLEI